MQNFIIFQKSAGKKIPPPGGLPLLGACIWEFLARDTLISAICDDFVNVRRVCDATHGQIRKVKILLVEKFGGKSLNNLISPLPEKSKIPYQQKPPPQGIHPSSMVRGWSIFIGIRGSKCFRLLFSRISIE